MPGAGGQCDEHTRCIFIDDNTLNRPRKPVPGGAYRPSGHLLKAAVIGGANHVAGRIDAASQSIPLGIEAAVIHRPARRAQPHAQTPTLTERRVELGAIPSQA